MDVVRNLTVSDIQNATPVFKKCPYCNETVVYPDHKENCKDRLASLALGEQEREVGETTQHRMEIAEHKTGQVEGVELCWDDFFLKLVRSWISSLGLAQQSCPFKKVGFWHKMVRMMKKIVSSDLWNQTKGQMKAFDLRRLAIWKIFQSGSDLELKFRNIGTSERMARKVCMYFISVPCMVYCSFHSLSRSTTIRRRNLKSAQSKLRKSTALRKGGSGSRMTTIPMSSLTFPPATVMRALVPISSPMLVSLREPVPPECPRNPALIPPATMMRALDPISSLMLESLREPVPPECPRNPALIPPATMMRALDPISSLMLESLREPVPPECPPVQLRKVRSQAPHHPAGSGAILKEDGEPNSVRPRSKHGRGNTGIQCGSIVAKVAPTNPNPTRREGSQRKSYKKRKKKTRNQRSSKTAPRIQTRRRRSS